MDYMSKLLFFKYTNLKAFKIENQHDLATYSPQGKMTYLQLFQS